MLKGKTVIGKDILSRADGEKLSSIKDLIIAGDNSRIVALLTDEGGLFSKAHVVPIEKVVSFGKDVVVITDRDAVVSAEQVPAVKESLDSKDKLLGKTVFTERGDEQARVEDIYFNEANGTIMGLELSGGALENSPDGTAYLPVDAIISIGQDAVVIRTEAVTNLLAQASGVQGTARTTDNS